MGSSGWDCCYGRSEQSVVFILAEGAYKQLSLIADLYLRVYFILFRN